MKMLNMTFKGIIFASALGFAGGAFAGPKLWIGDSGGNLGTVDATTGAASVIGNMGNVMTDIAFDPSGNLYGITSSSLYKINTSNASTTFIGSLGSWSSGRTINALVFDDSGKLYAAGREGLFTINTTTGLASLVGFAPFIAGGMNSSGDLAFVGGKLYLTSDHFGPDDLWNVNPSSMSSSFPVNYPGTLDIRTGSTTYSSVFGLASPDHATLYGVNGTTILNISTTNATATVLANYGGQGLGDAYGSAFFTEAGAVVPPPVVAIPEPETYAMLLAGLGLLGFAARRRKQKEAALA